MISRDGRSWEAPRTVADSREDDRNPALGQLRDGTIILAYAIASGYDAEGRRFESKSVFDGVYAVRSRDKGRTWSAPARIESTYAMYGGKGAVSPYGKIVQLADGTALLAVYYDFRDSRGNESWLFRSKDGGRTWGEPSRVGEHANETALAVLPGGGLVAAMRSEKGGHLSVAHSADGGRTWSEPAVTTADNEHPADLLPLRDGRLLLTYGVRNAPMGVHALVSRDGGRSWERKIVLASDAPNRDCGYPSSVEIGGGRVLTVYYQVDDLKDAPRSAKAKAVIWRP